MDESTVLGGAQGTQSAAGSETGSGTGQGQQQGTGGTPPASGQEGQQGSQQQGGAPSGAGEGQQGTGAQAQGQQSGEGAAAGGDGAGSDGQAQGAPEQYEAFTLPEGFSLDEQRHEQLVEFARAADMSQEQAQQAVDMHVEAVQQLIQQQTDAHAERVAGWAEEARQDPEFGGAAFDANVRGAAEAVAQFGGDALKQVLDETGLGNHPAVIRAFWKVRQAISEDSIHPGGGAGAGPRDPAEIMYGSN